MDLLTQIINCKTNEEADEIVKKVIEKRNSEKQPIKQLGFLNCGKSINCYEGFIPLDTRIKYATLNMETYSMNTTDYFYEFTHFIRKYKVDNKASLIYNMMYFIDHYFGPQNGNSRENIFNDYAWKNSTSDDEYFEALENNKIGDLKGTGAAQCTEIGALAQQLLSFFGAKIYYCMGCFESKGSQEGHCFNIIKRKNDYALLDYSIPVYSYNSDGKLITYYPFVGKLSDEEFKEFISNGILKEFSNYQYVENKKEILDDKRTYVVGSFTIDKEKNL